MASNEINLKLSISTDGLERIEAGIQKIESLATEGIFTDHNSVRVFHKITSEARKLRQTLLETVLITPRPGKAPPTEAA